MRCNELLLVVLFAALAGCTRSSVPPPLLGTLEWDRIAVAAEASEPVVAIAVHEGDTVQAGQLLLELDARRSDADLTQAEHEVQRLQAQLAEALNGARSETIDAARADLNRASSNAANAERERTRAAELRARGLNAQADLDRADTALKLARADVAASRAKLAELTRGTRSEDIDQATAALAGAQARADSLRLTRERLRVVAPQAGRVDALPFKLGDQPPRGATLVSLLSGPAPYARIYVPEARRASLKNGTPASVRVDGVKEPFHATVRSIRSEPSFTPYYALTGDDASRLVYRAELVLEGDAAKQLPAGLPAQADLLAVAP